jgi:hypothetical protein
VCASITSCPCSVVVDFVHALVLFLLCSPRSLRPHTKPADSHGGASFRVEIHQSKELDAQASILENRSIHKKNGHAIVLFSYRVLLHPARVFLVQQGQESSFDFFVAFVGAPIAFSCHTYYERFNPKSHWQRVCMYAMMFIRTKSRYIPFVRTFVSTDSRSARADQLNQR